MDKVRKSVTELSDKAKDKAFQDFVKFTNDMGHEGGHTLEQFVEVSEINGWQYNENGDFIG